MIKETTIRIVDEEIKRVLKEWVPDSPMVIPKPSPAEPRDDHGVATTMAKTAEAAKGVAEGILKYFDDVSDIVSRLDSVTFAFRADRPIPKSQKGEVRGGEISVAPAFFNRYLNEIPKEAGVEAFRIASFGMLLAKQYAELKFTRSDQIYYSPEVKYKIRNFVSNWRKKASHSVAVDSSGTTATQHRMGRNAYDHYGMDSPWRTQRERDLSRLKIHFYREVINFILEDLQFGSSSIWRDWFLISNEELSTMFTDMSFWARGSDRMRLTSELMEDIIIPRLLFTKDANDPVDFSSKPFRDKILTSAYMGTQVSRRPGPGLLPGEEKTDRRQKTDDVWDWVNRQATHQIHSYKKEAEKATKATNYFGNAIHASAILAGYSILTKISAMAAAAVLAYDIIIIAGGGMVMDFFFTIQLDVKLQQVIKACNDLFAANSGYVYTALEQALIDSGVSSEENLKWSSISKDKKTEIKNRMRNLIKNSSEYNLLEEKINTFTQAVRLLADKIMRKIEKSKDFNLDEEKLNNIYQAVSVAQYKIMNLSAAVLHNANMSVFFDPTQDFKICGEIFHPLKDQIDTLIEFAQETGEGVPPGEYNQLMPENKKIIKIIDEEIKRVLKEFGPPIKPAIPDIAEAPGGYECADTPCKIETRGGTRYMRVRRLSDGAIGEVVDTPGATPTDLYYEEPPEEPEESEEHEGPDADPNAATARAAAEAQAKAKADEAAAAGKTTTSDDEIIIGNRAKGGAQPDVEPAAPKPARGFAEVFLSHFGIPAGADDAHGSSPVGKKGGPFCYGNSDSYFSDSKGETIKNIASFNSYVNQLVDSASARASSVFNSMNKKQVAAGAPSLELLESFEIPIAHRGGQDFWRSLGVYRHDYLRKRPYAQLYIGTTSLGEFVGFFGFFSDLEGRKLPLLTTGNNPIIVKEESHERWFTDPKSDQRSEDKEYKGDIKKFYYEVIVGTIARWPTNGPDISKCELKDLGGQKHPSVALKEALTRNGFASNLDSERDAALLTFKFFEVLNSLARVLKYHDVSIISQGDPGENVGKKWVRGKDPWF